jgi:RNA polymerase sigma-70 factor (ECF subfamily)
MASESEVTLLLNRLATGDSEAAEQLWPLVYEQLRVLAERYLKNESPAHTLQATALVNEAYVRLAGARIDDWAGRAQFLGVAARAMRRILIDHARRRGAAKRGGDRDKLPLDSAVMPAITEDERLVVLNEALERLATFDLQLARLVELHFFGGMTLEETAWLLEVSPRTAKRMWKMAKGWLHREMIKGA